MCMHVLLTMMLIQPHQKMNLVERGVLKITSDGPILQCIHLSNYRQISIFWQTYTVKL